MWKYNNCSATFELYHYDSPYYDPVKAHEYYIRTRELKGRSSSAGLNDKGREAVKYVKKQLDSEKKRKLESARTEKINKENEFNVKMQREIATLKAKLKGMSKEERAQNGSELKKEIQELRLQNQAERDRLNSRYKNHSTRLTNEYKTQYESELSKIRNDASFKKIAKKKTGGKSK